MKKKLIGKNTLIVLSIITLGLAATILANFLGSSDVKAVVPGGNVPDGTYYIVNQNSGKALDNGGSTSNASVMIQFQPYNGNINQKWNLEHLGGNKYKVISAMSNQALDVYGGSLDNGAAIIQWPYGGGENQKWYFESQSTAYPAYVIKSALSGKAIDVTGGSQSNGIQLVQWVLNGGENQIWVLIKAN